MNRPDDPQPRSGRAAREDLERALRETLARQVAAPRPLAVDPAGQAVRRAERLQRRRTLTGVALAAVATVAVSTGMAQLNTGTARSTSPTVTLGDPSGPPATASVPSPSPTLDGPVFAGLSLIAGSTLVVDGRGTDLGGVGPVERALPDGHGWLLIGTPGPAGRTVWAVGPAGTVRVLLAGADAVAADPAGKRLAWREGTELLTATIVDGNLLPGLRTPVPESSAPVGFVGDDVLVRVHPTRPGFALWRADGSQFEAGADRSVLDVYGRLPDGRLVARVTGDAPTGPCLALLDPARALAVSATGCAVPVGEGPGSVSPDGRWLLVNRRTGGAAGESALLVDLRRAFGAKPVLHAVGPAVTGAAAWPASEAAYPAVDGTLVRFRPGRSPVRATSAVVPGLPAGQRPALVSRATL